MKQIAVLIVTISVLLAGSADAQGQDPAPVEPNALLADEFARAALSVLALPQSGEDGHPMVLAAILLDQALELDPSNSQLWTFRVELAQTMGDIEAQEAALRGYLATGADDDKAQYDLLLLRLSKHQTLDEQYRALEQLLDSDGARRLSDPLRSRLASFAASLAQELVDPRAQARWVVESARLDPANAEAAAMLLGLVIERGGDSLRQGTARINVVRASPMDPWARLGLADALASEAAYERAIQQYQLVDNWIGSSPFVIGDKVFRELLPVDVYRSWLTALATTGNDPLVLQIIGALEEYYLAYHEALDSAEAQGVDVSQAPALPEQLPWEFELIRLAVLDGPSDTDAAAASLARIQQAVGGDTGPTPGELALWASVFGPDLALAQTLAEALPEGSAEKPIALGWLAARRGEAEAAEQWLRPLEATDAMAAAGLVLVDELDDAGRARAWTEVMHRAPADWSAIAAGRRLSRDGRAVPPSRVGQALLERMTKFPESLWLADLDRNPWIDARLRIRPARFNHLDPVNAEITIWNTSRFPIAIGESEVVRPRAILQITASVNGQPVPPLSPIVIDLGRKLTLDAGERMILDTRLDFHQFGLLRSVNPGAGVLFDVRLIVNPVVGPTGAFIPAATGGVSTVRDCIGQGVPPNAERIEGWLAQLDSNEARTRFSAIARLAGLNRERMPELITDAIDQSVRAAITEHYPRWDELSQAWAVMFLSDAENAASIYGPIASDLVRQSDSERVWLAYLVRQVSDPDSPMIGEAIRRQDLARVASFAETWRRALREARAEQERRQREFEEQQRLQQQGGNGP